MAIQQMEVGTKFGQYQGGWRTSFDASPLYNPGDFAVRPGSSFDVYTTYRLVDWQNWVDGDIAVLGISFDVGDGSVTAGVNEPNISIPYSDSSAVYVLDWTHAATTWVNSVNPGHQAMFKIKFPTNIPAGNKMFTVWGGVVDAGHDRNASNVRWLAYKTFQVPVATNGLYIPQVSVTNIRWSPTSVPETGGESWFYLDIEADTPTTLRPFTGIGVMEPGRDTVFWHTFGGGAPCNELYLPTRPSVPPPNGCNGSDTWSEWSSVRYGSQQNGVPGYTVCAMSAHLTRWW